MRYWLPTVMAAALFALPLAAAAAPTAPHGWLKRVAFSEVSPLGSNAELMRRLVSPLRAAEFAASNADAARVLAGQPLDPARQAFALFVPTAPPPPAGYALLVFVPPWPEARVPAAWIPVLERTRTILVTAAHSGNAAQVLQQREPLALMAEWNVSRRYPVDPAHVYVGGFSGGSRIALRLALAYPDVFHGALLDAGSDPVGTADVPFPSAALLHRFQDSSRVVFVTGDQDYIRQAMQERASAALRRACAFHVDTISLLHTGHVLADAAGFADALAQLSRPAEPDVAKTDACRVRLAADVARDLKRAEALVAAQRDAEALRALTDLDARYGGLAAPHSVALWRSIRGPGSPGP